MHDAVALVTAAPAIEGGDDDALGAGEERGPAQAEGEVRRLAARPSVPGTTNNQV